MNKVTEKELQEIFKYLNENFNKNDEIYFKFINNKTIKAYFNNGIELGTFKVESIQDYLKRKSIDVYDEEDYDEEYE